MGDAEDQAKEFRALIGLLARANGLERLPAFTADAEPADLPDVAEAVNDLSDAKHVPANALLEVLGRLVQAQQKGIVQADTTSLAKELTRPDLSNMARISAAKALLQRLTKAPEEGKDRIGRSVIGPDSPDAELPSLVPVISPELQSNVMIVRPKCGAETIYVNGVPALNIITDVRTPTPLVDFYGILNPLQWPKCGLESCFFTDMQLVPPGVRPGPTPPPDDGWQATLLEVVDFSFGFGPPQEAKTELNFVFFFNPNPGTGQLGCAGSTYDFNRSLDNQISVDQGFLLVEDLGPPSHKRRYRTQKLVHMQRSAPPADNVCDFWSAAVGLIQQGCAAPPPAQP